MHRQSNLPLSASRMLVSIGGGLCALCSILLLIAGILLLAWPDALAKVIDEGANVIVEGRKASITDSQPWISFALFGAAVMLGMAADVLRRMMEILKSVARGDVFTASSTAHLKQIGWIMIAMQIVALVTGWVGRMLPVEHNIADGFSMSFSGLLAALLAFVLAQVFEQARGMRDELEGTV